MKHGKVVVDTVTSVRPNEAECSLESGEKKRTIRVVDYPGHVKLRSGADAYLARAKKIVFVTDALAYNDSEYVRGAAG